MLRIFATLLCLVAGTSVVSAQEYCIDKYNEDITKVNGELGGLIKRQGAIDKRIAEIFVRTEPVPVV
jgi:hypothetical protein